MTSTKLSRSGETVLIPPSLPAYLSGTYNLKPIVGKPTDEDVKEIHAVIRSLNAVAHLPALHNPDLSMQLSQHLFGAQMAMYQANYSMSILPGDQSVYTPPSLPPHINGALEQVIGAPSDEEIKSVQSALRSVENLALNPQLFDADVSTKLSQHLFNLQFARYMHDSAQGNFAPDDELENGQPFSVSQLTGEPQEIPNVNRQGQIPRNQEQNGALMTQPGQILETPSGCAQLGEEITKQIKPILENINRILISTQRTQTTVGFWGSNQYYVYQNPVNQRGELATEHGLPELRHVHYQNGRPGGFALNSSQFARYLKFFDIGADLVHGDEDPRLIDGKDKEATRLLQKQVGFVNAS